jgi:hypothetical protein
MSLTAPNTPVPYAHAQGTEATRNAVIGGEAQHRKTTTQFPHVSIRISKSGC